MRRLHFHERCEISVALKNVACTYSYANMVASAVTGIASMIDSIKQASQCDEASRGTTSVNKDICSDSIKAKNPRTPGCANTLQKSTQIGGSNSIKTATTDKNNSQAKVDGISLRNPADTLVANVGSPNGNGSGENLPTGGGGGSSSQYREYLPGGTKDPNKGIAGQEMLVREVTGPGGKSNWEKVKNRYRDNKNTLLND